MLEVTENHMRIVYKIAHVFHRTYDWMDLDQLISDGQYGLAKAAKWLEGKPDTTPFDKAAGVFIRNEILAGVRKERNRLKGISSNGLALDEDPFYEYVEDKRCRTDELVVTRDQIRCILKLLEGKNPALKEAVFHMRKDVDIAKAYGFKSQASITVMRKRFLAQWEVRQIAN